MSSYDDWKTTPPNFYDEVDERDECEDRDFIAHAREDVPNLLSEIARLRRMLGDA